jgi:hypothetical protein
VWSRPLAFYDTLHREFPERPRRECTTLDRDPFEMLAHPGSGCPSARGQLYQVSVPSSMGGFKWRLPKSFCRYRILPQTYCDACKFTHGGAKYHSPSPLFAYTTDDSSTQSWSHARGRAHNFIWRPHPCSARPSACLPPRRLTSHPRRCAWQVCSAKAGGPSVTFPRSSRHRAVGATHIRNWEGDHFKIKGSCHVPRG